MASRHEQLKAKLLIQQAAELMGWKAAQVTLEGKAQPSGMIIGDAEFFEAMEEDEE